MHHICYLGMSDIRIITVIMISGWERTGEKKLIVCELMSEAKAIPCHSMASVLEWTWTFKASNEIWIQMTIR